MTSLTLSGTQLTLAALKGSDKEAFEHLLSTLIKSGISATGFYHDEVVVDPAEPGRASVSVSLDTQSSDVSLWPYNGLVPISYRRVAMEALTARYGAILRADIPSTVQEMMAEYFSAAGLYDRSEQFIDRPIDTLGDISLNVKDNNFLLYGAATLKVMAKQRQLKDVLVNKTIAGFRLDEDMVGIPQDVLYAQLQVANEQTLPYAIEPSKTTVTDPVAISGYRYDNTSALITATGEGYYLGSAIVVYTRYDFGWTTSGTQFVVSGPGTPTLSYLLAQVSLQSGFPLEVEDMDAQVFPPMSPGDTDTLTLTFKTTHLRYVGELTIDYTAV